jgi:transposase
LNVARRWRRRGFLFAEGDAVAPEFELHIICDNYSTHKHAKVTAWLKRHPRFHIHFIPTSSSWLNLVERFFGEITAKVIRPGSFSQRRSLGHRHLSLSRSSQSQSQSLLLDGRTQAELRLVSTSTPHPEIVR